MIRALLLLASLAACGRSEPCPKCPTMGWEAAQIEQKYAAALRTERDQLKAQLAECRAGIVVPPASQQSATP